MKKITTKLSNLHKLYNVLDHEKELFLDDDIFIESINEEYVKINALIKKHTPMIKVKIENVDLPYICAEKHIIMTPDGWDFMINADYALDKFGGVNKITEKEQIGIQDSYDVNLDEPNTYVTTNGLIHHNTFLALYKGIEEVLNKDNPFNHVVIIRSAVQVRDQGFVPGSLEEKMSIYETPYVDICSTLFGRDDAWNRLREQKKISFMSTTAIRGVTLDDAIIIVDECQSMTWHELNSIISRCGFRSKILFVGDLKQNDLIKNKHDISGLKDFLLIARTMSEFTEISFTPDDIVRSSLVKSWIIACENSEN